MEFEVTDDLSTWMPVSIRQDPMDSRREAVWVTARQVQIDRRMERELQQFARTWDRNLRAQGFLAAAMKGGGVPR